MPRGLSLSYPLYYMVVYLDYMVIYCLFMLITVNLFIYRMKIAAPSERRVNRVRVLLCDNDDNDDNNNDSNNNNSNIY